MILFFMSLFKLLLNNSFLWLKAFLAIPILVLISVSHLPSLVMRAPRYLNPSTCSSLSPSIVMFITPSPFLDIKSIHQFLQTSFRCCSHFLVICKPHVLDQFPSDLNSLLNLFHSIYHHHFRIHVD